jgi:PBSX family phage portal protein
MPVRTIGAPDEEEIPTASNAIAKEDELYGQETIRPIFPPADCYQTYQESALLPPYISALATNIEMFGHRLEPTIDLDAKDAREKVRDAMILERLHDEELPDVTDEDVDARMLEIRQVARQERLQLEAFFRRCCPDMPFVELRERMRYDLEITGNAYWEVVRDHRGWISEFNHVEAMTMRLTKLGKQVLTNPLQRISDTGLRRMRRWRRFRKFVQLLNGAELVWFKELGDPQVMSSKSGRYYDSEEDLCAAESGTPAATEILHWKLVTTTQPYGIPKWIGAAPSATGERQAEVLNRTFVQEGGIPPGMLLVSGGTIGDGAEAKIADALKKRKHKGPRSAAEIPIVEATPHQGELGAIATTKVSYVKLRDDAQDATNQEYIRGCAVKIGAQFRVPKILVGDMTDFNRSTAEAAIDTVEQQVFSPPREKVDGAIDQRVLVELGVRFWRFKSNGLKVRNPEGISKVLKELVEANIIVPAEARPHAADALGKPLDAIEAEWVNKPYAELTKQRGPADAASDLVAMRAELEQRAGSDFQQTLDAARAAEAKPKDIEDADFDEPLEPGIVAPAPSLQ